MAGRPCANLPRPCRSDGPVTRYQCRWCGYVYDPAKGEAQRETPPGTPFEALPDDWCCPDCRAPKADFDPVREGEAA